MRKRILAILITVVMAAATLTVVCAAPGDGGVASPTRGWMPDDASADNGGAKAQVPEKYLWVANHNEMLEGLKIFDYGQVTLRSKDAERYDKLLRALIKSDDKSDVELGSVVSYYLDILLSGQKVDDPASIVNKQVAKYVDDRGAYNKSINRLFTRLSRAKSVMLVTKTVKSQAYLNRDEPIAECLELGLEMPSMMVMEPVVEDALCLVYTFDDGVTLSLAVKSGFAPVDWEAITDEEPGKWKLTPVD